MLTVYQWTGSELRVFCLGPSVRGPECMKGLNLQPFFRFWASVFDSFRCLRQTPRFHYSAECLNLSARLQQLEDILRPVVEGLGYEFWGVEFRSQGKHSLLRLFIDDAEKGISVEDCETVSRQVSGVLDVEDPISTEYTLEVSSPGMDHPLFRIEQFEAFAGHMAKIKLRMAFEGRRNFEGQLRGVEDGDVVIIVDDHEYLLPFESIERASIVPVFE